MTPEDITVTVDGGEPFQGEWGQVQYAPGLEERVAALEELIAHPLVKIDAPGWTEEQVEKFKAQWEAGPPPVLTPEAAKALVRECVTVVKPGETLVVRVPESWTPQQAEQYQEYADAATESGRVSFPVLVVIGAELGVARPDNPTTEG